jgi:hypothetical protein
MSDGPVPLAYSAAPPLVGIPPAPPCIPHSYHVLVGQVGGVLALIAGDECGEAVVVGDRLGLALPVLGHEELILAQDNIVLAAPLHWQRQCVLGPTHAEVLDPFAVCHEAQPASGSV